jgi:hypothetical protein
MKRLLPMMALFAAAVGAGTLYLPAYPAAVLVFDESKGQIVDRIPLATGTPMSMRLAPDRKKIYVTTIDHNGIEVIDVATRKVINHFVLNTASQQYRFRFRGGAADADGKLFYTVTKEIDKLPERTRHNRQPRARRNAIGNTAIPTAPAMSVFVRFTISAPYHVACSSG